MRFPWIALTFLIVGWPIQLSALDLYPVSASYHLQGELQILEDSSGDLDLQAIQSAAGAGRFRTLEHTNPNFGFSHSVFWFRLVLNNNGPRTQKFLFHISNPFLERVDFYACTNGHPIQHRLAGMQSPLRESNPQLWLDFDPGSKTELFIRVQTRTPYRIPVQLYSAKGQQAADLRRMIFTPFLTGIALFIVVLTAFQWLLIRERSFGYFFTLVLMLTTREFMFDGMGLTQLKPDHGQSFLIIFGIITTLTLIFCVLFGSSYLQLSSAMPGLQRYLYITVGMILFLIPLNLLDPFLVNRLQYYVGLILMLIFLMLAVERTRQGYQPALWLLLSQSLTMAFTVIFFLLGHGFLDANMLTLNSIRIASIQQIILFSLALTHRLRFSEKHYHTKLEETVKERTNELAKLIQVYEAQNDLLLRTTRELQENEEKFRALAHSAYDAVVLLTNKGLISFWNTAAEQMFGFKGHQTHNQNFLNLLIPPEERTALSERYQQIFRTSWNGLAGETFESKLCYRRLWSAT